jgi:nondiscriminating glutamyl-tRNA synthetase
LDDYVLIKSDGIPTYQFASVVDDHLMEISHVVRGEEWLPSYPKNISLYKSFGWTPPKFIHLPLVLDKNGGKLSKRKGDVAVEDFRAKGYLPEALLNFNALLGWSPYAKVSSSAKATEDKPVDAASGQSNSEIFTMEEAIKNFDYHKIGVSPAVFNTEKLDYLNGIYIRKKELPELVELCKPYLTENLQLTSNDHKKSDAFLLKVINLERERLKTLSEIGEHTKLFFVDNLEYDKDLLVWKKSTPADTCQNLKNLLELSESITETDWQTKKIEEIVMNYIKTNNKGVGDYLWPMRVALTGEKASPSPFEMADCLGKEEVLEKIKKAIEKLK